MSKLLEKVLLKRIRDHAETSAIIPDEQFGFRPAHSTTHQLYRIVSHVKREFGLKKSTGLVVLDIEKAFDTIWHDGLLHKLLLFKFPIILIKVIQSFLTDRSYYVHLFDSGSKYYNIPAGLPQGSALSPILYNIYISDLKLSNGCSLAQFADDTGTYYSHRNPKVITRKLVNSVKRFTSYFERWKIKLNESKTEAIFFTKRRAARYLPDSDLNLNSNAVKWSKSIKYLGVLLDEKVTFKKHVDYANERAQKYIRILYSLINRRSKLNIRNKVLIFKSVFRPIMLYGAPAWSSCAATHRKSLQVTQNKLLKIIYNKPICYSTKKLHDETKIKPISDVIDQLSVKFKQNFTSSTNPLIYGLTTGY